MPRSIDAMPPLMATASVGPSVENPGGNSIRAAASTPSRSGAATTAAAAALALVSTANVSKRAPAPRVPVVPA